MLTTINLLVNLKVEKNGRVYHHFFRETILLPKRDRLASKPCSDCGGTISIGELFYDCASGPRVCQNCVADLPPTEAWTFLVVENAQDARPKRVPHLGKEAYLVDNRYDLPQPNGDVLAYDCLDQNHANTHPLPIGDVL